MRVPRKYQACEITGPAQVGFRPGYLLLIALLVLCAGTIGSPATERTSGSPGQAFEAGSDSNRDSASVRPASVRVSAQDWESKRQAKLMVAAKPVPQRLPSMIQDGMAALLYVLIAAVLCFLVALVVYLRRFAVPPVPMPKTAPPKPPPGEKDPALIGFFHELWTGPSAAAPGEVHVEDYGPVPAQLEKIEGLFSEINHCVDARLRQKMLADLAQGLYGFKLSCNAPGLRVIWQCASILERLVKALAQKETEVTHSCLRTVAGGVDLLRTLSNAGELDDHLVTDPPVKLLAVDDNAICLRAIAMALNLAFPGLDLSADGASGLSLAQAWGYDAIFLDVEMPTMDGFELCSKIHQTALNQKTPVIFVTGHSDFDSRVKSAVCGGHELIGKPFLPLEIAFKAFALVAVRRLQNSRQGTPEACPPAHNSDELAVASNGPSSIAEAQGSMVQVQPSELECGGPTAPEMNQPQPNRTTEVSSLGDVDQAFFTQAGERLRSARFKWQMLLQAPDEDARRQVLESLRVDMQLLAAEAQRAQLDAAHRLAFALQALLAKLHERPEYSTDSCMSAITTALDVLDDLCLPGAGPDTAISPSRFLVVDDDPVALRAISGALQCNFGKPETADSGETALALAEQRQFDLIFMDVRMPGMDGFAACSALRQAALNSETPVVFVTSNGDAESREQAALVRGSGFIVKPVLPGEIRLTAITFSLRSRLDRLNRELIPS